eukprot:CAMPEP_0119071812 /NCGR_PEP_ID=MMETSP1178-20130426/54479_1 /TAXON_ID=33656 /ORGANISM="unid sp, Strain CCMP2000" /LENGTH=148 /DNA_ID=CAMNT_0007053771 /DNA_START=3 /DNA_END=449 /DNA_ORIENTATION=+
MGASLVLALVALSCGGALALSTAVTQDSEARSATQSAVEGGANLRPQRSSGSIFDAPDDTDTASSAWQDANAGILRDMRAHLERRKANADADLIRFRRGPILQLLLGLRDFLRSEALGNVFRSLGLFMGAWVWYVINTNTYMPPEYDD